MNGFVGWGGGGGMAGAVSTLALRSCFKVVFPPSATPVSRIESHVGLPVCTVAEPSSYAIHSIDGKRKNRSTYMHRRVYTRIMCIYFAKLVSQSRIEFFRNGDLRLCNIAQVRDHEQILETFVKEFVHGRSLDGRDIGQGIGYFMP